MSNVNFFTDEDRIQMAVQKRKTTIIKNARKKNRLN